MGVKAAGGARSYDAVAFVEAGATRIGTSAGVAILKGKVMATTELIELAIEASKQAYVPYSHFPNWSCFGNQGW